MRLPTDAYLVTQPIYYPGFTIAAGLGEGGGMLATFGALVREIAPSDASDDDWRALRNRWEYSHVLRAALACFSFVCLAVGVAI